MLKTKVEDFLVWIAPVVCWVFKRSSLVWTLAVIIRDVRSEFLRAEEARRRRERKREQARQQRESFASWLARTDPTQG